MLIAMLSIEVKLGWRAPPEALVLVPTKEMTVWFAVVLVDVGAVKVAVEKAIAGVRGLVEKLIICERPTVTPLGIPVTVKRICVPFGSPEPLVEDCVEVLHAEAIPSVIRMLAVASANAAPVWLVNIENVPVFVWPLS